MEPVRNLSLININTQERLTIEYWARGRYLVDALRAINHILRDHHDGSVHPMDPRLVDVLYGVYKLAGKQAAIEVICGYRSPHTNARLRRARHGVAGHSLHMAGRAVDIRVPGNSLDTLHRSALALRAGGVGYYPRSGFVHVDTGPVRTWGGHNDLEDYGETPEWRDALLSDTPRVEQAADAGLLPGTDPGMPPRMETVAPRSRLAHLEPSFASNPSPMGQGAPRPVAWPGHKPMRVASRDGTPVLSEGFWIRRKPRVVSGG
jgi:uncharacterized protein YcbK (DUF882 family)